MKRGKDEEKILEPMFPRLHVNDTEKGGPRAPPRNKMALYEQLTISSSQRFNNDPKPGTSSRQPWSVEINSSSAAATKVREEDDISVPVFINSRKFQCNDVTDKEKHNKGISNVVNSLDLSVTEEMDLEKSISSGGPRVNECNGSLRRESRKRLDRNGGGTPDDVDNEESSGDDGSDNSMVDSLSSREVSPDDVVGVLGQKRFWKARKAIADQQRVFAVQLFELHRLIKVQKLIAASPDLLLDDISFIGKVSTKTYPVKKLLPLEFTVKPTLPQAALKHRDDMEKTDQHKMEHSAENVVGKSSTNHSHSHHHQHQPPSNYMPFANNPPASPAVNGCYFPPSQPSGNQQWLIPVMSPSEGLIYKPHPGPGNGHTGAGYGGYYGHFMPAPMIMSNFMGNGGPQPFHPGVGFPSPANGYFPPYGMMPAMMNPYHSGQHQPNEQMNHSDHPEYTQQHSSVNEAAAPQQPTKPYPRTRKRQGGSSPSGISGKNSFRPFSPVDDDDSNNINNNTTTTTTTTTTVTQTTRDGGGVTRVIKVVPHNAKLASENAARIFQSIQEERKHYDTTYSNP